MTEKGMMKTSTNHEGKGKFHEARGETNEKSRNLTNDPTLEGKDENKGRQNPKENSSYGESR